jgi:hypothetical protein
VPVVIVVVTVPRVARVSGEILRKRVDHGLHRIEGRCEPNVRHAVIMHVAAVDDAERALEPLAVERDLVAGLDDDVVTLVVASRTELMPSCIGMAVRSFLK